MSRYEPFYTNAFKSSINDAFYRTTLSENDVLDGIYLQK
jgi:hypothetical protein